MKPEKPLEETLCGSTIPPRLLVDIHHLTILIYSRP